MPPVMTPVPAALRLDAVATRTASVYRARWTDPLSCTDLYVTPTYATRVAALADAAAHARATARYLDVTAPSRYV